METENETKRVTRRERSVVPLATAAIVALILLAMVNLLFAPASGVSAAPPAAPTPIANIPGDSDNSLYVTFQSALSMSADTNTTGRLVQGYEYLDLQTTVDQTVVGTENNTTTITIQFSNDGSNWDNGPAILSSNAADTTDMTRVQLFGRYVRFNQDVTLGNPITITLLGLAK